MDNASYAAGSSHTVPHQDDNADAAIFLNTSKISICM